MKRWIALIGGLLCAMLLVSGCTDTGGGNTGTAYKLYFANAEKNKLVEEVRTLQIARESEAPKQVMEALLGGPTGTAVAVIPAGTELLGLDIVNGVASVNLSKAYYQNETAAELLARYSIVNTLCELDDIDKVKLFVEGIEMMNSSNNPVGALGREDIVLSPQQSDAVGQSQYVKLYFSDNQAEKLVAETRSVTVSENNLKKTIVQELIKGPTGSNAIKTVPAEAKVLSVETQEGICFVNLSSEFVSKAPGGSAAEQLTVFSIVNSLTELDDVEQVQFLVEGKKLDVYKHMAFDQPFMRNESIIE